jgi:hypothetical protein
LAIYFDTNSLKAEGWPRVSAGLRNLRDLAKFVGVRLFLPGPVETELEALWLREFESKRSAFKNLRTHAGRVFQVELTLALPSDAELLTANRVQESGRGHESRAGHRDDPDDDSLGAGLCRNGGASAGPLHRPRQRLSETR